MTKSAKPKKATRTTKATVRKVARKSRTKAKVAKATTAKKARRKPTPLTSKSNVKCPSCGHEKARFSGKFRRYKDRMLAYFDCPKCEHSWARNPPSDVRVPKVKAQ